MTEIGTGHSLWLVPGKTSTVASILSDTIRTLASLYNTPIFPPHVTLACDIELDEEKMWKRTIALTNKLTRLTLELEGLASNGHFFQILFSGVKLSPELREARHQAEKIFRLDTKPYFSHLSLAYGDLTANQVVKLIDQVNERYLTCQGAKFLATDLELWRTIGPVSEWQLVESFSLSQ